MPCEAGEVFPLTELLGFLTGVINVWLLTRRNVWNWPFGLSNNALYIAVFLSSGLYGDAALQVLYIVLGIYGWIHWWRSARGNAESPAVAVTKTTLATWQWLIPTTIAGALILSWFLDRFTDSTVPVWDSATTSISLAATFGQARKLLESWWLWILADLIYIPLYIYKGLWLTAGLYLIFFALCIVGLREWRTALFNRSNLIRTDY